jgi:hypothetical protein
VIGRRTKGVGVETVGESVNEGLVLGEGGRVVG